MLKRRGFSMWSLKMAWRDSRSNRRKLFIYMSAIIIGVAAMVAIQSFRYSLNITINNQAKELLGADIVINKNAPFQEELAALVDSIPGEKATTIEFASMAYFPRTETARLSQITALDGDFPFFGVIEAAPQSSVDSFQSEGTAIVDEPFLNQFEIEVGDSVRIGTKTYLIAGALQKVPGQPIASSLFGPRIYIPQQGVEESGLLVRGSRAQYQTYIMMDDPESIGALEERLRKVRSDWRFGFDTVEERKEDIGEAVDNLSRFLNLIGFIALLLGGLGVASSIYVYIRQKISTVAVLRCFGASSSQTMWIYIFQSTLMGFIGATIGALLGTLIQLYLPVLVKDFLPVEIDLFISWGAIVTGIFTGMGISIIFALFPLLAVRNVSPLFTLRSVEIKLNALLDRSTRIILYLVVVTAVYLYAWLITEYWVAAAWFTASMIFCILLLAAIGIGIVRGARRFFPTGWAYVWRQGFSNLYRPNNQTSILILTFGLGITMISSLYLTQDLLLGQIDFDSQESNPNLIFYDIQVDQNDGVNDIITGADAVLVQNVPIVSMRLQELKGRTRSEILADTNRTARRWAINRDYRSTYRDSLIDSEVLEEGEWIGNYDDPTLSTIVPISLSADLFEDLDVAVGDTIVWDIQGIPLQSYVASSREVDWNRPQPNFFVVFPSGVLEAAPQFFASVVKVDDREQSIGLQRDIVKSYPNVSAFDISLVIETIQDFLDKVTFVIQFMGFFSIITGLIVLASSLTTSRFQRIREAVLLRTLGASQDQVVKIQGIEYFLLGLMASVTGLSLSVGASWILTTFYFEIPFTPNWTIILIEMFGLVALVLFVGLVNSRDTANKPPLEILRLETV